MTVKGLRDHRSVCCAVSFVCAKDASMSGGNVMHMCR